MTLRTNIYTDNPLLTFGRHTRGAIYVSLVVFIDILINRTAISHHSGVLAADLLAGLSILGLAGIVSVILLRLFSKKLGSVQSVVLLAEHQCFIKGADEEKGHRVPVQDFQHIELRVLGKHHSFLNKWFISIRWETNRKAGKGIIILSTAAEKQKFTAILEAWYNQGVNITEYNGYGEPAFLLTYPLDYRNMYRTGEPASEGRTLADQY